MTATTIEEDESINGVVETPSKIELVKARIVHVLRIYPRISPSMMQTGIGPNTPPNIWRPILEEMINEGIVSRTQETNQSETGRWKTSVILSLSAPYIEAFRQIEAEEEKETALDAAAK